jgi:hypothetical protein
MYKIENTETIIVCVRLQVDKSAGQFAQSFMRLGKVKLQNIKSKPVQTQINSIYYTELHVSTYFRSSSVSQFVFEIFLWNTNCEPDDDLK